MVLARVCTDQCLSTVNAFINAKLGKLIYYYCLKGFNENKYILKLLRPLYILKILLLLWYKELTSILIKFGLKPILNNNYLYINRQLIVFFDLLKRTF